MARQVAERRKNSRVDTDLSVPTIELKDGEASATLKNISRAGLACVCLSKIPEMTVVEMTIQLPALPEENIDYYPLTCRGAVVRCEPGMRTKSKRKWFIAIYFTEMDDKNREILQQYINRRS
jgi:c-di-GMP-binding flagellar brake protein YcgR